MTDQDPIIHDQSPILRPPTVDQEQVHQCPAFQPFTADHNAVHQPSFFQPPAVDEEHTHQRPACQPLTAESQAVTLLVPSLRLMTTNKSVSLLYPNRSLDPAVMVSVA